jgi:hypothetical protein
MCRSVALALVNFPFNATVKAPWRRRSASSRRVERVLSGPAGTDRGVRRRGEPGELLMMGALVARADSCFA